MSHEAKKSVDNTVFVRFHPPTDSVRRHHVEDFFSAVAPIKKSSVIHSKNGSDNETVTSSYGFVRYTTPEDAELAAVQLNNRSLTVEGSKVTVLVELARTDQVTHVKKDGGSGESKKELPIKKRNRLILRNLSFYAKERDVRAALKEFGELVDVHIPTVKKTHRGFCFVTFQTEAGVKRCLKAADIIVKDRSVSVSKALNKTAHQAQVARNMVKTDSRYPPSVAKNPSEKVEYRDCEDEDDDDLEDHEPDENESDESASDMSKSEESRKKHNDGTSDHDTIAVSEKRSLFLRNLPFDCTRHDIFESFRHFGHITAIYIVKDKETHKIPRGTAFVSFRKPEHASAALDYAATGSGFVSQRDVSLEEHREQKTSSSTGNGIFVKGRRLLVNLALDKQTASTLAASEKKNERGVGKDRRNLYLKGEGRVENDEATGIMSWDVLPDSDKLKRQTAWSEKNTKLRSPLFFINPNRLSIRNLAKHVDEVALKKLVVEAVKRGLENNVVTIEDQVAHWKAAGKMTTREIIARVQSKTADDDKSSSQSCGTVIPTFDEKNVRRFIPALHIHRDVSPGKKKKMAPSRGFAFVEFEHHLHALAALRELNNNIRYASDYCTGGKKAVELKKRRLGKKLMQQEDGESLVQVDDEGRVRIPRLVVDFTVENKAKAKQQAEHKAQQLANTYKQLQEKKERRREKKPKPRRGSKQRERKRKQKDSQETGQPTLEKSEVSTPTVVNDSIPKEQKMVKLPKKQRVNKDEKNFSKLVDSYHAQTVIGLNPDAPPPKRRKRWFE